MSMESDLFNVLKAICPRIYPDVAPSNVVKPYITWQHIGGESLHYGDNSTPDKRSHLIQVSVWSASRTEALSIVRQAEDAIRNAIQWQARPEGESISMYEPGTLLYGSVQRFGIFAAR